MPPLSPGGTKDRAAKTRPWFPRGNTNGRKTMSNRPKTQYISDVARMAGLERRELRQWEESGRIPEARRTETNHRVYDFDEARPDQNAHHDEKG